MSSSRLPRSRNEAIAAEVAGIRHRFLFFWGHTPASHNRPGPWYLSQWWPASFTEAGREFYSAEHYMMAHKAWLFGDHESAEKILRARHPGEAKSLGRRIENFDDATWEAHRYDIVKHGSVAKFSQNAKLGGYLLSTRQRILVEASPLDRVWGIGLVADDERASDPSTWRGRNLLGFALMDAREMLAEP